jgi:prephenate dehydrogenase
MRYFYKKPFRYTLTRPPQAIRRAKLDNIAIVPASMLTGKEDLQEKVKKLPQRQVFLYHTKENIKQKQVLERVKEIFRHLGYAVTLLSVEQV